MTCMANVRAAGSAAAFLVLAFFCVVPPALAQQVRKGGNPEAAKIENPVQKSPDSIAAGRKMYQRMCARCHGPAGKGDGSTTGTTPPSDLTDDVWDHGSSDGEIFTVIHDGSSIDMDGYAQRISETDIWNLVNYLRDLSSSK
jgi:mono/diheme cytochrome c family protein